MKNLKLLNKKYLSIILFYLLFGLAKLQSQEPVDIWNIEEKKNLKVLIIIRIMKKNHANQNSIYEMQSQKKSQLNIEEDKH